MTVPSRTDAVRLLLSLDPPAWFLHHARAVAEVAGWLGARARARGVEVSPLLAETAALLHDADKLLPRDDPARRLPHGEGSAAWVTRMGHPELAPAIATHTVTLLADGAWAERWLATASLEALIVAYADKRAGQRLSAMAARFASWDRRYPGGWPGETPGVAWANARRLEVRVCELAGVEPEAVRRLAWTGPALRAARAASGAPTMAGPATAARSGSASAGSAA